MRFPKISAAIVLLSALPLSHQKHHGHNAGPGDACAEIAQQWKSDSIVHYPAKLAQDCLKSVPFDGKRARFIVDQLRLYFQFFAAQTYYQKPPDFFELSPVNTNGTFDELIKKIEKESGYKNNLEFDHDLMNFFGSFRHSAVDYVPACSSAFLFQHDHPLYAVSPDDPKKDPKIYAVRDPYTNPHLGHEVTEINGKPVVDYLKGLTKTLSQLHYVDPDARWNDLFFHRSNGRARLGVFAQRFIYPEDPIVLKYKEGKEITLKWTATVFGPVATLAGDGKHLPWTDKASFLQNVCLKTKDTSKCKKEDLFSRRLVKKRDNPESPAMWGYPSPPAVTSYGRELSLYLFDKFSVLVISAFDPHPGNPQDGLSFVMEFQMKLLEAVQAIKDKDTLTKKKRLLIVDLSHNDGGKQILAHETARVLLPGADHYFMVNRRYSPGLDALMSADFKVNGATIFNPAYFKNEKGEDFKDARELLGPVHRHGDYFTNFMEPDHDEMMATIWQENSHSKQDKYWTDPDIVIVADGLCDGACAILLEALQAQNVRVATYGGRPGSWKMQGAGGLKGHSPLVFDRLNEEIYYILEDKATGLEYMPKSLPINLLWGSVGLENRFRKGESSPMEFHHKSATWTQKYTKSMFDGAQAIWEHTYYLATGEKVGNKTQMTAGDNKDEKDPLGGSKSNDEVDFKFDDPLKNWNLAWYIHEFFSGWSPEDGGIDLDDLRKDDD